jgi:hypothetical protein
MGMFTEVMLPEHGVRFIAIANDIDSAKGNNEFAPFMNLMSEWYARDTSKKIRTVFNARTQDGKRVCGTIPYGYVRDPADNQKWVVDEGAAAVVRRIFDLVIGGKGVYTIAGILEKEKILIPAAHWDATGADNPHAPCSEPYRWRGATVSGIVAREDYTGRMILRKTYSESYKLKKRRQTPKEDRLVFEGAIPAIIDEATWNTAQRLRRTMRRPAKDGREPYRLTGLLYCADCGAKMTHMRTDHAYPGHKSGANQYICSNYRQNTRACSMHFIRVAAVEELALEVIRRVSRFAAEDEARFVERVREASALRRENEVKESRKRLSKSKRRHAELDGLVKKLYETYAAGKIPENHFERLLEEYDGEQAALTESIAALQSEIDAFDADSVKADKFLELARRYTDFTELTTPMLNEFVGKIVIHEADKSSGKRVQKVDIHLNFIGKFDLPMEPPTPKEIEAERKLDEKRRKGREYAQRCRERKHDAGIAAQAEKQPPDAA